MQKYYFLHFSNRGHACQNRRDLQGFTLNAQYREGTIFFLSPASHEIMRYCVTHGSHTASCSSVVCDTPTRGWRNTMHCVLL